MKPSTISSCLTWGAGFVALRSAMGPYDNMTVCNMSSIQRNASWHVVPQLCVFADQCVVDIFAFKLKFNLFDRPKWQNFSVASDQHPQTYFQRSSLLLSITLSGHVPLPTCPRCPAFIPNPSHPKQLWWPRLAFLLHFFATLALFNPLQPQPALAPSDSLTHIPRDGPPWPAKWKISSFTS